MRPLAIEFMPRRPRRMLLIVWTFVCLLATADFGYRGWQIHQQAQALDRQNLQLAMEINRLEQAAGPIQASVGSKAVPPYYEDAAAVAKMAGFPVQQVLKALETVQVMGVRVSSIDIHPDRGSADVVVEFTDHKALLAYLEQLNDGEQTPRWRLKQSNAGVGVSRGSASITAIW